MTPNSNRKPHPTLQTLALYSRGDLPLSVRWRTRKHVRECEACERQVALFRAAETELKREAREQTLTAFEAIADWSRLEREMLGNIGVGIAAARCIENVHARRWLLSPGALAGIALAFLFVVGWFTHIPRDQTKHLAESLSRIMGGEARQPLGTIVETTPDGIAVRAQGGTLTIMHPPSAVVSIAGASGVAARYVDQQTGQVTIANVYGQ